MKLITANTDWAVTLEEAKTHLKVDDTTDDAYIQFLCESVQEEVEEMADLGLTAKTWELHLDEFPGGDQTIEIWMWPVSAVGSVKYTDGDGNTQTVSSSNYATELDDGKPAKIQPIDSYTWPTTRDTVGAVQVQFTTGFTSPMTCPSDLKSAMLLIIADRFDNREDKGRRFNRVSERIINKYKYR